MFDVALPDDEDEAAVSAAAAPEPNSDDDSDFLFNTLNIIPRPVFVKFPFTCRHQFVFQFAFSHFFVSFSREAGSRRQGNGREGKR